ncbi:Smr/MutS family protein [Acidihalobacter ferrooxydans]|uniref:Smr/MutS family protein n=1 Tax=Acidihalobacter ferrooxydans TaxID=1765967 RepID=UPI0009F956B2|nr:Smr/MutS family protein [Acidihalobacter ferrooxydans]
MANKHAKGKIVRLEITDTLDLHHFKPSEVPDLVREYLRECDRLGISEIRIIHGKGKGVLRKIVQDILAADPRVIAYGSANDRSGWGATDARLKISAQPESKQASEPPRSPKTDVGFWQRLKKKLFRSRT